MCLNDNGLEGKNDMGGVLWSLSFSLGPMALAVCWLLLAACSCRLHIVCDYLSIAVRAGM